ncbi:hypothetical protein IID24_03745 [Patescibacteria group bacterium]|nr:hypothetical protein [Patescibacteria group bacterium]
MKVSVIKKEANGISDFSPLFYNTIRPIPIISPVTKTTNKATRILGHSRNNPINKVSFHL